MSVRNTFNGLLWIGGLGALHGPQRPPPRRPRPHPPRARRGAPRRAADRRLPRLERPDAQRRPNRAARSPPVRRHRAVLLAIYSVGATVYVPHLFSTYATRYGVIGAVFAMISALFCVMVVLVGSAAAGREVRDELARIRRGESPADDEVHRQWDEVTGQARRGGRRCGCRSRNAGASDRQPESCSAGRTKPRSASHSGRYQGRRACRRAHHRWSRARASRHTDGREPGRRTAGRTSARQPSRRPARRADAGQPARRAARRAGHRSAGSSRSWSPAAAPGADRRRLVGVDWGVETFATLCRGPGDFAEIPNDRLLLREQDALKAAQRDLSRALRGKRSRRAARARRLLAKRSRRLANRRKDRNHQVTARLAREHGVIVTEDLSVKGMTASAKGTAAEPGRSPAEGRAQPGGPGHGARRLAVPPDQQSGRGWRSGGPGRRPQGAPLRRPTRGRVGRRRRCPERTHTLPDGRVIGRDRAAAWVLWNIGRRIVGEERARAPAPKPLQRPRERPGGGSSCQQPDLRARRPRPLRGAGGRAPARHVRLVAAPARVR